MTVAPLSARAECDCGSRSFTLVENVDNGISAVCLHCEKIVVSTDEYGADIEVPEYRRRRV